MCRWIPVISMSAPTNAPFSSTTRRTLIAGLKVCVFPFSTILPFTHLLFAHRQTAIEAVFAPSRSTYDVGPSQAQTQSTLSRVRPAHRAGREKWLLTSTKVDQEVVDSGLGRDVVPSSPSPPGPLTSPSPSSQPITLTETKADSLSTLGILASASQQHRYEPEVGVGMVVDADRNSDDDRASSLVSVGTGSEETPRSNRRCLLHTR